MATIAVNTLVIAGINLQVYSDATNAAPDVVVLFLLHGRTGSAKDVTSIAESVLNQVASKRTKQSHTVPGLIIVAFDHRNHGSRLVDPIANSGWTNDENHNDRHIADMYSIFVGSSQDVSFLIDFLPAYLYPSKEKVVSQWIISGISLGGHSAWVNLRTDPRLRIGIPIIGCADYLSLMSHRAAESGIPFQPPHLPNSLRDVIKANDPAGAEYKASDGSNPFIGKKILALVGGSDKLVPFSVMEDFFTHLNVGEEGIKRVVAMPGVGHECTPGMVKEMTDFIWDESLRK